MTQLPDQLRRNERAQQVVAFLISSDLSLRLASMYNICILAPDSQQSETQTLSVPTRHLPPKISAGAAGLGHERARFAFRGTPHCIAPGSGEKKRAGGIASAKFSSQSKAPPAARAKFSSQSKTPPAARAKFSSQSNATAANFRVSPRPLRTAPTKIDRQSYK